MTLELTGDMSIILNVFLCSTQSAFSRIFLLAWIKKSKVPGIQPNDDKNHYEIKKKVFQK